MMEVQHKQPSSQEGAHQHGNIETRIEENGAADSCSARKQREEEHNFAEVHAAPCHESLTELWKLQ
jgi:hypothetical protein